jgi:ribosomal protein L20
MGQKNMVINRKVLADLAVHDPETFAAIVTEAHA